MKTCTRCGCEKPDSEFYRRGKYLHSWCKPCYRERYRQRYAMYEATGTAALRMTLEASEDAADSAMMSTA